MTDEILMQMFQAVNQQLGELSGRVSALEERPVPEPRIKRLWPRIKSGFGAVVGFTNTYGGTIAVALVAGFLVVMSVKGGGCQLPFVPTPGPSPDPTPVVGKIRVLVTTESKTKPSLPAGQIEAITAKEVRDYCQQKCAAGPDGKTPEFRELDLSELKDLTPFSPEFREMIEWARTLPTPALIIRGPNASYKGLEQTSVPAKMALLRKYGG